MTFVPTPAQQMLAKFAEGYFEEKKTTYLRKVKRKN
jgi:hypothetical protein